MLPFQLDHWARLSSLVSFQRTGATVRILKISVVGSARSLHDKHIVSMDSTACANTHAKCLTCCLLGRLLVILREGSTLPAIRASSKTPPSFTSFQINILKVKIGVA